MGKGLRILILEDIDTDAELIEQELQRAGILFSVKRVKTREAFLEQLKRFLPDLVLADYKPRCCKKVSCINQDRPVGKVSRRTFY